MSQTELSGRYRVEARIGSGGMAEVFRGFDNVLNRTVAIKTLHPQFARDAGFVHRFRREAQAAARLNQPNIVGVYDTGADDGTQYIVMEFIQGRTLAEYMAEGGRFTPIQAVEVAEKIADAMAYAHAQGVVHRDLKPANVMVTRDGVVKVMDFGIARIVAGPETAPKTSAVLGTAAYISPEQVQAKPVDGRTDIYSLGAVLYEMLTGRPPFTGDSAVAIAYKQVNETPVPPSQLNQDVPPQLDAVVMRSLAKNPANRYQSAAEFRDDLERVRKGQQVEATPLLPAASATTQVIARPQDTGVLPTPPGEEPGGGRKVWLGVLIGILAVAILAGGGYLLAQSLLDQGAEVRQVPVPRVIGQTLEEAERILSNRGLEVVSDVRVNETADPGTVFDQDPLPGDVVNEGSTVTILVAREPRTFPVPSVIGLTVEEAEAALSDAGLQLGSTSEAPSAEFEEGTIIDQSPAPDEEVPRDTPVDITVSTGPDAIVLDDYTCLPFGNAKAQLQQLGLNVDQQFTVPNTACPNPNRVAAQDPGPGEEVEPGSTVTLFTGSLGSPSPSDGGGD
jgi:eukaryotic-like serine/threonine-protein kinase